MSPSNLKFANTPEEKREEARVYQSYYTRPMFDWWITHPYRSYTLESFRPYLRRIAERPGALLLEPGSGAGVNLSLIQKEFPTIHCFGFDLSPEGVRVGSRWGKGSYWRGDAENIAAASASADAILAVSLIHHFWRHPDRLLDEIHRVLKPGGYLFVMDPNSSRTQTFLTRAITFATMKSVAFLTAVRRKPTYQVTIPESETEQPISPEFIETLLTSKFQVLESGLREWVTFCARHHGAGFPLAKIADRIIHLVHRRQMNIFYAVAQKRT